MVIATATVRTSAYTTVFNHLQTGTYAISTDNIHPSWNDAQFRSEGHPQVIIIVEVSEEQLTLGRDGLYEIPIQYTIECHHSSAANARTLADEVVSKFRGAGKQFISRTGLLKRVSFDQDQYDRVPWTQGKSDHIITLTMNGVYIGKE